MSLINDALKRARESQRNDPPSGAPPLPPVESPARGGAGWILVAAAILFLAAAGLFIGPALFGHKVAPVAAPRATEVPAPPRVDAAPVPADTANIPPEPVASTNPPPAATDTNPPPPPAAPVEQLPKVQGVIFNPAHPLAIVNGKAVSVGDRVGDFQVKQIMKNSVVFQRPDGSRKTLEIGE